MPAPVPACASLITTLTKRDEGLSSWPAASYYRENLSKWKTYQETFNNKFRAPGAKPGPPQLTAMQLWLKDAVGKTTK